MNRSYFEDTLVKNIKRALYGLAFGQIYKADRRIYIDLAEDVDPEVIATRVSRVFGVVSVSLAERLELSFEVISAKALEMVNVELQGRGASERPVSFKVECRRINKEFPLGSLDLMREVGAFILERQPNLRVDVHHPELTVYIEIREQAYLYTRKIPGFGGMPYGTNGKALMLLSGGIDSPVAGWMMAKRGVELAAVHFHSYPFTSERARDKVIELLKVLSGYCGRRINLHLVNLLDIQRAIREGCPEEYFTILSRRFMMYLAEAIARNEECAALITGESIGQVARQTILGMQVTNSAVQLPVFRPLIDMDKVEITDYASRIGTYEISIQPYEDCCTVFLPKRPATKPRLDKVLKLEANLDREGLIATALQNAETRLI